ncbi:hypothetical protein B6I21_06070 [candidate division KSB1 bacterium 4572_119]|nr:MAG: hypothetical protein B6I21_06070 [candidate division KSB1 bacterium 4572_119]
MKISKLQISAPGRICLFGEHQDYLSLPVITAAINLRIYVSGVKRNDKIFKFEMPDLNESDEFPIEHELKYNKERDYLRSAVNILLRQGVVIPCGYDCEIRGDIPINSGTSSSSAMIVAWIKFLLTIAKDYRRDNPLEIARLAHQAEVLEFAEPGGKMDHFATSIGGVLFIDFDNNIKIKQLQTNLGQFVLGDSLEAKDTKGILSRVKGGVQGLLHQINEQKKEFDLKKCQWHDIERKFKDIPHDKKLLLQGTIENRDLTTKALSEFENNTLTREKLGDMLFYGHQILKDKLKISTSKLDLMIAASKKAGACGGKLNGSGGGGCMFAYTPENAEEVVSAIKQAGGKSYIVEIDSGVKTDFIVYG